MHQQNGSEKQTESKKKLLITGNGELRLEPRVKTKRAARSRQAVRLKIFPGKFVVNAGACYTEATAVPGSSVEHILILKLFTACSTPF